MHMREDFQVAWKKEHTTAMATQAMDKHNKNIYRWYHILKS